VLRRFIGLCLEMFMLLRDINTGGCLHVGYFSICYRGVVVLGHSLHVSRMLHSLHTLLIA
jgi:hypothetical protein